MCDYCDEMDRSPFKRIGSFGKSVCPTCHPDSPLNDNGPGDKKPYIGNPDQGEIIEIQDRPPGIPESVRYSTDQVQSPTQDLPVSGYSSKLIKEVPRLVKYAGRLFNITDTAQDIAEAESGEKGLKDFFTMETNEDPKVVEAKTKWLKEVVIPSGLSSAVGGVIGNIYGPMAERVTSLIGGVGGTVFGHPSPRATNKSVRKQVRKNELKKRKHD